MCRTRCHRATRAATATVELSLCLPFLAVLVLGTLEAANIVYLRQALAAAAHQGAREAITSDATPESIADRCAQVLAARPVRNSSVQVIPAEFSNLPRGSDLAVRVEAPCAANSWGFGWFYQDLTVAAEVTMAREAGAVIDAPAPTTTTPKKQGGKSK